MAIGQITAQECYQHLGFTPFDGTGPHVQADVWRPLQETDRLADLRQRYLIRREQAGQPIVHEGFVIGKIPPNSLHPEEVDKLLSALTDGIAHGCATLAQWREFKAARRRQA